LADTLGQPDETSLHVCRKSGNFGGDSLVQDFDSPKHSRLYLNFEI